MADFQTFNLGQVLQTAEGIKAARSQSTVDRLREQYMGEQIKTAQFSRESAERQQQMVLGKEKAQQIVAKTGQILQTQNPKNYVEQYEPDLVKNLTQNGVDWATVDDEQLRQMVTAMQNKANQELGVAPLSTQEVGGFNVLQRGNEVVASAAPKQATPDAITERWKREVEGGYQGSLLDYQKELKAAGASQVNVNAKQETEEAKAIGKELGKQYVDIQKAGTAATGKVNKLDRLSSLLDGVRTGKLTPKMTEVAAFAESLGVTLDPKLDAKQGAQALIGELVLQARNPAGGAGMPGAMSDADREFLKSINPSLGQTTGGNKLIIETLRKIAKRDQDVARMAREYRTKNGTLEGFSDELAQWSAENELFDTENALSGAAPAVQFNYVPGQGLQPVQ
jgi:hypothetical protein